MSIWNEYKKIGIIKNKVDGIIYKVKNKKTGNYLAIEEINKKKINMNDIKKNNLIKEIIEIKEKIYIIMELCICNLEYLMKIRDIGLSINEIKEILNEIIKIKK
jgi:serine/threonine protein kinase